MTPQRITLLGRAGVGKTTFARALGARLNCPAVILDELWRREWAGTDLAEFRRIVAAAHSGEAWVSDGNFALATFDLRLPGADLVIWLDAPTWLCAWRAVARVVLGDRTHRWGELGKVMAFIRDFNRVNRPRIEAELTRLRPDIAQKHLSTPAQVRDFLARAAP